MWCGNRVYDCHAGEPLTLVTDNATKLTFACPASADVVQPNSRSVVVPDNLRGRLMATASCSTMPKSWPANGCTFLANLGSTDILGELHPLLPLSRALCLASNPILGLVYRQSILNQNPRRFQSFSPTGMVISSQSLVKFLREHQLDVFTTVGSRLGMWFSGII
jgi:hypothetical protein